MVNGIVKLSYIYYYFSQFQIKKPLIFKYIFKSKLCLHTFLGTILKHSWFNQPYLLFHELSAPKTQRLYLMSYFLYLNSLNIKYIAPF